MKGPRLLLTLAIVAVPAACTPPADPADDRSASRPHEAPDLEALLPSHVAGRELARWSVRGGHSPGAETDQQVAALRQALASEGLSTDEIAQAVAGRIDAATEPPYLIVAFRFDSIPGAELPRGLGIDHPQAGAWSDRTIAGRLVHVGTSAMLEQNEHQRGIPYVFNSGPIRAIILADDETWAADALRQLPGPGEGAGGTKAPRDVTGARDAPTVPVPAGEFLMGSASPSEQAGADERPQHKVVLAAFSIDTYEVTNARYAEFLDAVRRSGHSSCDSSEPRQKDHTPGAATWSWGTLSGSRKPVVNVDWYDAAAYCAWAGRRLPTEAEWEKAARGTDGRVYPWGNAWDPGRANSLETGLNQTADVGSYPAGAGPYGAQDMAGNVWEWVRDWYGERYYDESPRENPAGPSSGTYRVVRGGSAINNPGGLRTATRNTGVPSGRISAVGFRCALDQAP